jgi:hypothetical protein
MSNNREQDGLDDNLIHARAAYANAQDVIKFVDTKTTVLTGIVTITTGIPLVILRYVLLEKPGQSLPVMDWCAHAGIFAHCAIFAAIVLLAVGFACGLASLLASTNGLMARTPRKARDKQRSLSRELGGLLLRTATFGFFGKRKIESGRLTCLFPMFASHQAEKALANFQKLGRGEYTRAEILEEYSAQLESVGSILHTKILRNRKAVEWFERQIFAYLACVAIAVVVFVCSNFRATSVSKTNPSVVRQSATNCP